MYGGYCCCLCIVRRWNFLGRVERGGFNCVGREGTMDSLDGDRWREIS